MTGTSQRRGAVRRRSLAMLAAAGIAAASVPFVAGTASAVLPTLPDNLVIFPDRDFVTVEGFDGVGQTARVRVLRSGTVLGQASGGFEPAGGVAFEVNHPGGWCWGQGESAAYQVTPDIKGGDRVEIELTAASDGRKFDVPVANIKVLTESRVDNVVTVTSLAPGIPLARMEGRIIAPDLTDTLVGRRDVRATTDSPGGDGYTSTLVRDGDNVVATYTFQDPPPGSTLTQTGADLAQIALAGDSRIMSWAQTVGADRLGITIAEHNEPGGPGMGGCPPGPNEARQPAPGNATVQRSADGTKLDVFWSPATSVAGAPAPSGYQVSATDGAGAMVGKKVSASATQTQLSGLVPTQEYAVEVRTANGDQLSVPFAATVAAQPTDPTTRDTTPPTLNAPTQDASTGAVTLSATGEVGPPPEQLQIYFTTGVGSAPPVTDGDMPANGTTVYDGPIPVTAADTVINYAVFDAAGNFAAATATFQPVSAAPAPRLAAPVLQPAVAGQAEVTLTWSQVANADRYRVTYTPAGGAATNVNTTARTLTVTGLQAGVSYSFQVTAISLTTAFRNSLPSNTVTATPTRVLSHPQITRAEWKTGDFKVVGVTDVTSGFVDLYQYDPATGNRAATAITRAAVTAAVAPATGGDFTVRLRNGATPPNPGWLVAVADDGAVSPPFQVSAR